MSTVSSPVPAPAPATIPNSPGWSLEILDSTGLALAEFPASDLADVVRTLQTVALSGGAYWGIMPPEAQKEGGAA